MSHIFVKAMVAILLLCLCTPLFAQKPIYTKGKYQFPIKGNVYFTGNMGEIRPNHFHAGLDVLGSSKTPIYATYDGYVGRVKASTYGYGQVVYLTHPETNQITVYAHMSRYAGKVGDYVRRKQYEYQDYFVDLYPQPNEIKVKKGELIGYVGNTGHSFGAHLHYEIRNGNETALNPLLFFDNIVNDVMPPRILNIGVVPLEPESRIFGKFQEKRYSLSRVGKDYKVNGIIQASGPIGLEINTYDVANGAHNTYATSKVRLKVDGKPVFSYFINNYPMDENRAMNVHINYDYYLRSRQNHQRLYKVDGNYLNIYKGDGVLRPKPGQLYDITIEASDIHGNTSRVFLKVKGVAPTKILGKAVYSPSVNHITSYIKDQTLVVTAQGFTKNAKEMVAYFKGIPIKVPLAYVSAGKAVYLWDIQKGIPEMVRVGTKTKQLPNYSVIPSAAFTSFKKGNLSIFFGDHALFDTTALVINSHQYNIRIGNPRIPITRNIEATYHYRKAGLQISNTKKWGVFLGRAYQKTEWNKDGTLTFYPRKLGTFKIMKDVTPPVIRLVGKSSKRISFRIMDNLSGIKKFKAKLNGKFLLMLYEHKGSLIWSDPNYPVPLKGKFELLVWDTFGNVKKYETTL